MEKVSRRIGIKGRAIVWEHAEPCMDVDKPHQLEMLRNDLARVQKKRVAARRKTASAKSASVSGKSPQVKKKKAVSTKTAKPKTTVKAKLKKK